MPLVENGVVTGGVDLYAASGRAFEGHHDELAGLLGAWAGGAVVDADLGFRTREDARGAPAALRHATAVETAVGRLAVLAGIDVEQSRERLRRCAQHMEVSEPALARALTDLVRTDPDPPRTHDPRM